MLRFPSPKRLPFASLAPGAVPFCLATIPLAKPPAPKSIHGRFILGRLVDTHSTGLAVVHVTGSPTLGALQRGRIGRWGLTCSIAPQRGQRNVKDPLRPMPLENGILTFRPFLALGILEGGGEPAIAWWG